MIQLSSLMWATAIFFTLVGFLRGWSREVIATAGIVLALFALFQFDAVLRSTILLLVPREQAFLVQALIFLGIVFFAYQTEMVADERRGDTSVQTSILGGIFGFLNGYLIAGSLWYFMDINEYPLTPQVIAPAQTSPSADAIQFIPTVLLSGGVSSTGDLMTIIVIGLLFIVVAVAL